MLPIGVGERRVPDVEVAPIVFVELRFKSEADAATFRDWLALDLRSMNDFDPRKPAASRRLAEAGATEKEIGAVTGHLTQKEVARYTRAASQAGLARSAIAKITEQKMDTA